MDCGEAIQTQGVEVGLESTPTHGGAVAEILPDGDRDRGLRGVFDAAGPVGPGEDGSQRDVSVRQRPEVEEMLRRDLVDTRLQSTHVNRYPRSSAQSDVGSNVQAAPRSVRTQPRVNGVGDRAEALAAASAQRAVNATAFGGPGPSWGAQSPGEAMLRHAPGLTPPTPPVQDPLERTVAGSGAARDAPMVPYPTVQVSMVAMRLHKILGIVREAPGRVQSKDCWRRIDEAVSGFKSDMLWLNDHAHYGAVETTSESKDSVRGELDLSELLRSHSKPAARKGICHIKYRAGIICPSGFLDPNCPKF